MKRQGAAVHVDQLTITDTTNVPRFVVTRTAPSGRMRYAESDLVATKAHPLALAAAKRATRPGEYWEVLPDGSMRSHYRAPGPRPDNFR